MTDIVIPLKSVIGTSLPCRVTFRPVSTPFIDGSANLILSPAQHLDIGTSGVGTIGLEPGYYRVSFSICSEVLNIGVPDSPDLAVGIGSIINAGTTVPIPIGLNYIVDGEDGTVWQLVINGGKLSLVAQ